MPYLLHACVLINFVTLIMKEGSPASGSGAFVFFGSGIEVSLIGMGWNGF